MGDKRFVCPHCCRAGGKIGGSVQGELVCSVCVKDGVRVQEVIRLIYKALPAARESGKPIPHLIAELFVGWCKLRKFDVLAEEGQTLVAKWRHEDVYGQP